MKYKFLKWKIIYLQIFEVQTVTYVAKPNKFVIRLRFHSKFEMNALCQLLWYQGKIKMHVLLFNNVTLLLTIIKESNVGTIALHILLLI